MSQDYSERELREIEGWRYRIDPDDRTAWIDDGHSDGQAIFTLPEFVTIDGMRYRVTSVELGAFYEDPEIEELIIPDSYEYIDSEAFHNCAKLRRVHIGKGLKSFCFWCFAGSPIEVMTIDPNNPYLKMSEDGSMVLSKDGKHLYYVVIDKEELVVPEGVEVLGADSISCHEKLEKLALPSTLKVISTEALAECRKLTEIVLPYGVIGIWLQAFRDCGELKSLDFPATVEDIGFEAISYNDKLETIILRANIVVEILDSKPMGIPTESCRLIVPAGLIEEYRNHPYWKSFENIKPL